MRAPEQVLVHLFCFLLSPFLCAGPDRILIKSKQFINLKSCLRVAIQLVQTFFFGFVCLFFTERKPSDNHLTTFVFLICFFKLRIFVSSLHLWFLYKEMRSSKVDHHSGAFPYRSCVHRKVPAKAPKSL